MRTSISCAIVLLALGACSGRSAEGGDEGTETDAGGSEDTELRALCSTGCERFETCAPDELDERYGDRETCEEDCYQRYVAPAACRSAAEPYANCTADLACADWPSLLADPATSPCAAAWEGVAAECDFG